MSKILKIGYWSLGIDLTFGFGHWTLKVHLSFGFGHWDFFSGS
jgi:hypothetical protein